MESGINLLKNSIGDLLVMFSLAPLCPVVKLNHQMTFKIVSEAITTSFLHSTELLTSSSSLSKNSFSSIYLSKS